MHAQWQTVAQIFYTLLPLEWKRYIDDIFSLWNVDKKEIEEFIVVANSQKEIEKEKGDRKGDRKDNRR